MGPGSAGGEGVAVGVAGTDGIMLEQMVPVHLDVTSLLDGSGCPSSRRTH